MSADTVTMPDTRELVPMLGGLIGRDLEITATALADPTEHVDRTAPYVDDDDRPVVHAGADLAFAMYAGAALAMIPKARAEDAIRSGTADEDLMEIYWEVLNVLTRIINSANEVHVRLVPGGHSTAEDLSSDRGGISFTVDIDGYGSGTLSFWHA
ncbi:MAG: hypothetical protein ACE5GB_03130 [Acidimicrobiales bacterium]